ncbi:unnamed protein product [Echinostoma caproni]|uniref:Uncharacterized protein n=1 Tax=Echinostoma caproni TaxID=27848 RepID=A0A183AQD2_9TREM|nr:unnamed protein product [Echinostoma caproni]
MDLIPEPCAGIGAMTNNVLHLWPYLIEDLRALGAKTFFGKFCAGSIDHVSIRTLQCILLKAALLFGVQVFVGVTYRGLIEPVKIPGSTKFPPIKRVFLEHENGIVGLSNGDHKPHLTKSSPTPAGHLSDPFDTGNLSNQSHEQMAIHKSEASLFFYSIQICRIRVY